MYPVISFFSSNGFSAGILRNFIHHCLNRTSGGSSLGGDLRAQKIGQPRWLPNWLTARSYTYI